MTGTANADHPCPNAPGGIAASMRYLQQQEWWPAFRERRCGTTQLIDDVMWVGHFCGWLQERERAIEWCGEDDLCAYLSTARSFRPGPRAACERTVKALFDFMTDGRSVGMPPRETTN